MQQIIMLNAEELRSIIREEVEAAVKQVEAGRDLPPLLTREELMDLMRISSTTASKLFEMEGFPVFRRGKLLIDTELLFKWIRKHSTQVEEVAPFFRSIS